MMNFLKKFLLTTAFITRLPLHLSPEQPDEIDLSCLSAYLPAVGLFIGALLLACASALNALQAGTILSAAVLTVAWLLITGGIHFDGLMDTADGIFSHRDQKRMLEIMSDSRVGNFGAMTGWCTLLLKFAALTTLTWPLSAPVLLVVPAWARWCETYAIGAFPYLREQGMGKIWHDTTRFPQDIILASGSPFLAIIACQFLGWQMAALSAIFAVVSGMATSYWLNSIIKGQTGDTYGACVELSETGALLLTALCIHLPALHLHI